VARTRGAAAGARYRLHEHVSEVLDFQSRDVPGPVGIAAMIGFAKAIFEIGFGVIGVLMANSMDDSFGGGVLAFGIVYAIASYLLSRGNRLGYYVTILLSALAIVVAIVYALDSEGGILGGIIVIVALNALVLYLLLGRESAREFFRRA
jgi:uncharacterized membrane protein (UPF0136 family)